MTRLFPARRSAERFDALVEGRHDDVDASAADLLELVGALRSVPRPEPRPEFVADLREQLMVAARTELVAPVAGSRDEVASRLTIAPRRTRRERRISIALGAAAIVGATTSMAVASQGALPGDALYPVKRALESTQTGLSVGDDAKGQSILANASGRLDEVDQLTRDSHPDAGLVRSTLVTFSDQATQAGDLLLSDYEHHGDEHSITALHQFTAHSMDVLGTLESSVPASAEGALIDAAKTLFTLDAAADQVCPDCGSGITEIPPQLLASGTSALDDASQTLAGDQLAGTQTPTRPTDGAEDQQGSGAKDNDPSGVTPPETPISIPSVTVDPTVTPGPTSGPSATSGIGDLLPSTDTTSGIGTGHHGTGHGKPTPPVDVTPVTDAVNDAVNGVVNGVNDVLNGLTGN